jgi:hypothetical protein
MENELFFSMPFKVCRLLRIATEMAGGFIQAIPHQAAVMKLAFPSTSEPTRTAGMG